VRDELVRVLSLNAAWEAYSSITHAEFLSVRRQFVSEQAAGVVVFALVSHKIVEADSAVLADESERDLPVLQQPDQIWPGDVQQVGGLLGCQLSPDGQDGYSVTLGHLRQDVLQEASGGQR
jgi:hypothetical protein